MYEIEISDDLWKTIFAYLGTLSWPIIILIIICIFQQPIAKLISNLKTAKWKDLILEFGDMVKVYSPDKKKFSYGVVQPAPRQAIGSGMAVLPIFSNEKIDPSYQRALDRIKEDTERVGYTRGKPYQLANGKWAVAWELELSAKIGIKDSLK